MDIIVKVGFTYGSDSSAQVESCLPLVFSTTILSFFNYALLNNFLLEYTDTTEGLGIHHPLKSQRVWCGNFA